MTEPSKSASNKIVSTPEFAKFKELLGKVLSNPPKKNSPKPAKA